MQANSVLLWQAILHAKHSACNWFDIGGLNEATPEGIAKFKQGLNAMPYELVGEWRRYSWVYLK
jgi:lipid II:glycine glycyltransferase (peptidoglycan interpeptide bridge formation enzyme)